MGDGQSYDSLTATFVWDIPVHYHIGMDGCKKAV